MKQLGQSAVSLIFDIMETLIIGVAVFLFTYVFIGQLLMVSGDSMLPNFVEGEQIVAEKVSIKLEDLKRGDIVVFRSPVIDNRLIIKRVIGLPGEVVTVKEGKVYVNGAPLSEPYLAKGTITEEGKVIKEGEPVTVPADSYIFMGDNRSNSTDSRDWGPINKDLVLAKGFLIYYPFNKFRLLL